MPDGETGPQPVAARPWVPVLAGDGIGREVTVEVLRLAQALVAAGALDAEFEELDWGAERYLASGEAVPLGGFERLRRAAAVLCGAFGDPRVPGHEHAREILLGMRAALDLYVNLRPVRCLDERLNPLRGVPARDIDLVIVRENTEGLYCGAGGVLRAGTPHEIAVQEMLVTRHGVERVIRYAFELAASRPKRVVTLVDKANALRHAGAVWQRAFGDVAAGFPAVRAEHLYVDAAAMLLVRDPARFDVVVTDNLFGDILSEVAAALQGGLGLAPSANLRPGGPAMFEPVHGSAPELAGAGIANPMAALASFALLLRHLGYASLAGAVEDAIAGAVRDDETTPDLGGGLGTAEVGAAVRRRVIERVAA
jgi:3-isopropylmalate dehydrogenase